GVAGKRPRRRHLSVDEFTYLKAHTTRTPKVTLPSPSLFANFWSPETSRGVYPTLEAFLADVVDILRAEVAELVRRGALYIQLDAPHYALLLEDKTVVLGLVTTKSPRMETVEGLEARVRAASRFVPLEHLALSPQCGFSTSVIGNRLSVEDQRRKLEVVVRAAKAIWGRAT